MSFKDCIDEAFKQGLLDEKDKAEVNRLYDEIARTYARKFGPGAGAAAAAQATMEALERAKTLRRFRLLLQRNALKRTRAAVESYVTVHGKEDWAGALLGLIDAGDMDKAVGYRQHYQAILGQLHNKMTSVLEAFRPTVTGGTRNPAQMQNLVRELFGEETGDRSAKDLAKAFGEMAEYARLRFNAAGGDIGKLADWGAPQSHDSLKVRRASKDEWVNFTGNMLDTQRMLNRETSLPFTPEDLRKVLGEVYDNIAQDGWAKRSPMQRAVGSQLATRRADPRFLIFKDAKSWMDYQARFGEADIFSTIVGHADHMARDTAAMELFGPSPTATLHFIEQHVRKHAAELDAAAGDTKFADSANAQANLMWNGWDILRGTASRPINGHLANAFYIVRNSLSSALLGKAAISAFTGDLATQRLAAKMAGLDHWRLIGRYSKLLNPANAADRALAVRMGLIADSWSAMAVAQRRYSGDFQGPAWSKRISHTVMNLTGLSPWTQAGRWAFGMEFAGTLADHAALRFDQLPDPLKNTMARHHIDAGDWDAMRAVPVYDHDGSKFLRPDDIAAVDGKRADKLLAMIQHETEFAVPSFSVRGEAHFLGKGREPGTFVGELVRSGLLFRSYGVTFASTHLMRRVREFQMAATPAAKARALAGTLDLLISTTAMGALALQMKQISSGRDPRPMLSPEFLGSSFLQGGGVGVFSDFLFTDINAYGKGLPETVAGAPISFMHDALNLTVGNVAQLVSGEKTNFVPEAERFITNNLPGRSMWYSELILQRLLFDRLQLWSDPTAAARMRSTETKYRNEFGQDYWWRPGRLAPERAPNLLIAGTEGPNRP